MWEYPPFRSVNQPQNSVLGLHSDKQYPHFKIVEHPLWKQAKRFSLEKMRIEVKCCCGECKEWMEVDLQGSLEFQNNAAAQEQQQQLLRNLAIGSLCCPSKEKYYFTVGYHELEGKMVALKKPLLVLRRLNRIDDTNRLSQLPSEGRIDLEVVGIIRRKLLFKSRPKALISKPEFKTKVSHSSELNSLRN
ncbi:hypothetical protein O6H91_09G052300 [Diphasiastrum complanatum]|uniref:Uncharacterized protein n=1 Tax=Diphasiastrum complanatum TaxID=34168 RepID=A0ACC2CP19_DIPCM|nr:hypothetical protein O6H91_09G052300 [Diphasiastrum complanatum]